MKIVIENGQVKVAGANIAKRVTRQPIPVKLADSKYIPFDVLDKSGEKKASINLEVAESREDRALGLSKYAELDADKGMLFTKSGLFWMKGMSFPIDIIFTTKEGQILEIQHMPLDPHERKVYGSKSAEAAVAIETVAGWAAKHKINTTDRFKVSDV